MNEHVHECVCEKEREREIAMSGRSDGLSQSVHMT